MYFKQFYLGCLAHASYLIGSDGEAAVVDPQRDVDQYLEEARANGLAIKYVLETHLHADFVSGHRELAARTGAEVVFGARAHAAFPHRAVRDGDELAVGRVRIRVLETPGHTPESISLLVTAEDAGPSKVLTGDTLFIGDVGRPDLVGSKGHSAAEMAGLLFDSLHEKLLALPDETEVFPAHGAGSLCGRSMSSETSSTIGAQRRENYALRPMRRDEFIRLMTSDLPEAPAYFPVDAEINRTGAAALSELPAPAPLPPAEVQRLEADGATVLDVRDAAAFGAGHVPFSVNIGLGGQFASWAGSLLGAGDRVVLVADGEDPIREARVRLARVGLENVVGYLDGGIAAWDAAGLPLASVPQISVADLRGRIGARDEGLQVVDVRRPMEYASGHVPGAVSAPLSNLDRYIDALNPLRPTAVICAGGYRSSAAASLLERHGFQALFNVTGGTGAWLKAGFPTE